MAVIDYKGMPRVWVGVGLRSFGGAMLPRTVMNDLWALGWTGILK